MAQENRDTQVVHVANALPAFGSNAWQIDPSPRLVVGGASGNVLLSNVRHAFVLSTGTLVVVEAKRGFFRLLYVSPNGQVMKETGRYGTGPGEFTSIAGAFPIEGDSVLCYSADRRFAVFDSTGQFVRAGVIGGTPALTESVPLGNGRLAVVRHEVVSRPTDPLAAPTTSRLAVQLLRIADGARAALGTFSGMMAFGLLPYPFSPQTLLAGGNGVAWVANSATDQIDAFNARGERFLSLTTGIDQKVVLERDMDRYKSFVLARREGDRRREMNRWLQSVEFPKRMPRMGDMMVDRLGNLWVLEYEPPWHKAARTWHVFGAGGAWLTTVSVPSELGHAPDYRSLFPQPRVWFLDIGADYIVMLHKDEMNVPEVRVHPLRR